MKGYYMRRRLKLPASQNERVRVDERLMGRTEATSSNLPKCTCPVLPWEDCEHSAWDAYKSLELVAQESLL